MSKHAPKTDASKKIADYVTSEQPEAATFPVLLEGKNKHILVAWPTLCKEVISEAYITSIGAVDKAKR